jgi:GNAT superfamily N-acetyltransferase
MRRGRIDDAEAIARIHVEAYEKSLGEVVSREVLDRAASGRHPMWVALLSQPPMGQAVFVHEDDKVIGFISAGPSRERDPAAGEVYALFVYSSRWGSGIGDALLKCGLDHLRSLELTDARLWVLDKNDRARTFYEKRGWVDTGQVREDERGRFLRYGRTL